MVVALILHWIDLSFVILVNLLAVTSWTSLPTEEAFITLRALGRVALTFTVVR